MAKGYAPDEGGMQSYAQGVAEAYAAMGARVTVFGQSAAGPREERVSGVLLVDVGPGKSAAVPLRLRTAMQRHLLEAGKPLFVHGTTWRTSLLPLSLGLPYVTTFHGREFMGGGWLSRRLMLQVAMRARAIVAVSRYSGERLKARLGPRCPEPLILWNGLSIVPDSERETLSARPDDPVLLLSICRLEPRKNIAACVRASAILHREGHAFRYIIGGRGPELASLRALVAELGLAGCVKVVGKVPGHRLPALYQRAGIFLHPQIEVDDQRDFEGFGITIADAMAHGAATIAGLAGGPGDIIDDGRTGLLVDGQDDAAIVAAMRRLIVDRQERAAIGHAARQHALRHFRWDRHVAAILHDLLPKLGG